MTKSAIKTFRNIIILGLLWIGMPSNVFHSGAREYRNPNLRLDYSEVATPPYIYDERGGLILDQESVTKLDSLIQGLR